MLKSFRTFMNSRFGVIFALVFLAVIALSFASADVAGNGSFGGVAGGDRVATVGDEKIGTADLSRAVSAALDARKQQQPTLTMPAFLSAGGLEGTLDLLIDRYAVSGYAQEHGLRAGNRLVDSEIASHPAFRGPSGKFDEQIFRQLVQQQGLSEAMVREDIAQGLMARQTLIPVSLGAVVPQELLRHYAALLRESRQGTIALLPSAAFLPTARPSDAQLEAYYKANRESYIRPERRVIRYFTFGADALNQIPAPTEAEIAARYKRDAARFAASETRSFIQLVAPTEEAAKAISAEVQAGKPLQAVAAARGLATAPIAATTRPALSASASAAVADAGFAATSGQVSRPARSSLGWHLLQVVSIDRKPPKSLAEAKAEIVPVLTAEKRRAAIADLSTRIEEQINDGSSLGDLAKELRATVVSTNPLTADGRVYMNQNETAPPVLARALSTAFAMEEGEPQLAEVVPEQTFLVFDVEDITPSAPAPLKEIREQVTAHYLMAEGSKTAKAAADRVMQRIRKGATLASALAAESRPLPAPEAVNLTRDELARMGERVPPALALFFSMAKGTAKRLEGPNDAGWFVVQLDSIRPGQVVAGDPVLAQARVELGALAGQEYEQQFRAAIRSELGVERNANAIKAVRRQLAGDN